MTIHISEKAPRVAELLLSVRAVACNLEAPFREPSGRASPVRVDIRRPLAFADERRELLRAMAEAVRTEPFDLVAGGETEGVPLGVWISDLVGLPYVSVRQETRAIEGEVKPGQEVLLVEERAADAGAIAGLVHALRAAGLVCRHAVVVILDGFLAEAPRILRDAGITLHAMSTWSHLIDAAEKASFFPAVQLQGLREFLKDPEAWSKAQGGG